MMIPTQARITPLLIAALSLAYGCLSMMLNAHTMISIDEFWYAHRIYQYRTGVPYRDFAPYKTVLGYYVLLLPMLFTKGYLHTLVTLKNTLSLINALGFFTSALWLTRRFSSRAVILALLAVMFSETVLAYATQIRVDILAYWVVFAALLALLDKRYAFAGVCMGLAFAISQKIIWYWFASNVGLGVCWLVLERDIKSLQKIIGYNVVVIGLIVAYMVFWSWMSSGKIVFDSVVGEASIMYHLDWYVRARDIFWKIILTLNPFLFLLAPTTLVSLLSNSDDDYQKRLFIVPMSLTVLLCLVPYDQVFPYYMQVTIPAFFLLYTSFFSWLMFIRRHAVKLLSAPVMLAVLSLGAAMIIAHILRFSLPSPYILLLVFPLGILILLKKPSGVLCEVASISMLVTGFFVGGVYPLSLFAGNVWLENPRYQQENLSMARSWLKGGGDYLAGVELFYGINQPIAGLRHLIGPAIEFLSQPTPKLAKVMTASQYEDKNATLPRVIADLNTSHVAFYINNYRIEALPPSLKTALHQRYMHWWGSLYTYAPCITPQEKNFSLAFTSPYRVLSQSRVIRIDGKTVSSNTIITLKTGAHSNQSLSEFRLQRLPPSTVPTPDPHFYRDQPARFIF